MEHWSARTISGPPGAYGRALGRLEELCGGKVPFRIAEPPIVLPGGLVAAMDEASRDLARQMDDPAYLAAVRPLLPAGAPDPALGREPTFVQFDYALAQGPDGLVPRLTELQAFPSLYAFQHVLGALYHEEYALPAAVRLHLGGLDAGGFLHELRRAVCGGHDPEQVALVDVAPRQQGTWPDFALTRRLLGIPVVDARELRRHGRTVVWPHDGREVPLKRIYNRLLWEDRAALPFEAGDVDVEWANHPASFLSWSKVSLPFLRHDVVPRAQLLSAPWPDDLARQVLKPLYGASGRGVILDVERATLEQVPAGARNGWLLQEKFEFADVLTGPEGAIRCEVRLMYLRGADGVLKPVMMLPRTSRGRMMGCAYNMTDAWTGHGVAFVEE